MAEARAEVVGGEAEHMKGTWWPSPGGYVATNCALLCCGCKRA